MFLYFHFQHIKWHKIRCYCSGSLLCLGSWSVVCDDSHFAFNQIQPPVYFQMSLWGMLYFRLLPDKDIYRSDSIALKSYTSLNAIVTHLIRTQCTCTYYIVWSNMKSIFIFFSIIYVWWSGENFNLCVDAYSYTPLWWLIWMDETTVYQICCLRIVILTVQTRAVNHSYEPFSVCWCWTHNLTNKILLLLEKKWINYHKSN